MLWCSDDHTAGGETWNRQVPYSAGLLQPIPIMSAESVPTNTLVLNEIDDSSRVVGKREAIQKRGCGKLAVESHFWVSSELPKNSSSQLSANC
jgi:hypothetical protein